MGDEFGVYQDTRLRDFLTAGYIEDKAGRRLDELLPQINASSIDLTLGEVAYEVPGSSTPKEMERETVKEMLDMLRRGYAGASLDLSRAGGQVLERGRTYIIKLNEELHLPLYARVRANTRSTIGRLDTFTRVIADGVGWFNTVPPRYEGPLYLEVYPSTFRIRVKQGDALTQLRLHTEHDIADFTLRGHRLQESVHREPLLIDVHGNPMVGNRFDEDGVFLTAGTAGDDNNVVGYKAKQTDAEIDVSAEHEYDPRDFWTEVKKDDVKGFVELATGEFFIMRSAERLVVPPHYAVEIVPHNERMVEARIHYAAFAHPGFGYDYADTPVGTPIIFEIRPREVPIALREGKPFAKLYFNQMVGSPEKPYNRRADSSYVNQGLELSKVFKSFKDVEGITIP